MIELVQYYFRYLAVNGLLYLICFASALSGATCLYQARRRATRDRATPRKRLFAWGLLLSIPAAMLVASWFGLDTIPRFFKSPLVIGGISGGESHSDGTRYFTINGQAEFVSANAPILRVAHVAIIPDPTMKVRAMVSEEGNTPDKFAFHGRYGYSIDGLPFDVEILIDGRARTFAVGGKTFNLARGNYFRIRIHPGPAIQADQLRITDSVGADVNNVKAVFSSHP